MLSLKSSIALDDDVYLGPARETKKHHKAKFCKKCGSRLALLNTTGECFRDCTGTGFTVCRNPKSRTYHDARACKRCGTHERYESNGACLECQRVKSGQYYHEKKKAGA